MGCTELQALLSDSQPGFVSHLFPSYYMRAYRNDHIFKGHCQLPCMLCMQDIAISAVLAMFYFGGAVPVAVRAGDWKFWRNRASEDEIQRYNFNNIVTSVEATAVSATSSHVFQLCSKPKLILWHPCKHPHDGVTREGFCTFFFVCLNPKLGVS